MTRLPAAGRQGEPPPWPLSRPSARERELWARIWRTPPAVAWEHLGWHDQVARYVRVQVRAERPEGSKDWLAEARLMEDRLGLNPLALLRLRWEIVDGEEAETEEGPDVLDIRDRLKAVE